MTTLSPAAQAVLNAFWNQPGDRSALAAALRAAADQVLPKDYQPPQIRLGFYEDGMVRRNEDARRKLLEVARELDGRHG